MTELFLLSGSAGLVRGGFDDVGEIRGFEAGATDQGTVDIGLAEEFGSVVALHGSAVEDADRLGGVFTVHGSIRFADVVGDDFVGIRADGGKAGSVPLYSFAEHTAANRKAAARPFRSIRGDTG